MKLVCPSCGAAAAADAWSNDAEARQALRIVAELPESVSRRAIAYLGLFRPLSGRGLKWSTALRHLAELDRLVHEAHVQVEHMPARPNNSIFWAQAMDQMIEVPPKRLPVTGHNYLRKVVYDIADDADRQAEQKRNAAEASGAGSRRYAGDGFTPIDPEEMRRVRKSKGL